MVSLTCSCKVARWTVFSLMLHFRDSHESHTYDVPSGLNHHIIPRSGFVLFSEMEIYVKAVNELGEATSLPITLEPISAGRKERTQPEWASAVWGTVFQWKSNFSLVADKAGHSWALNLGNDCSGGFFVCFITYSIFCLTELCSYFLRKEEIEV